MIFSHNILPLLLTHLQSGWRIILQTNCITQKFPPYPRFPAQVWANQSSHSAPAKQGDDSPPSQGCQQWYQSLLHAARSLQNCNGHHPLLEDLEELYTSIRSFNSVPDWGLFPKYSQVLEFSIYRTLTQTVLGDLSSSKKRMSTEWTSSGTFNAIHTSLSQTHCWGALQK